MERSASTVMLEVVRSAHASTVPVGLPLEDVGNALSAEMADVHALGPADPRAGVERLVDVAEQRVARLVLLMAARVASLPRS
ncbi:hypothetical protein GCM10020219_104830 [Nonomuraea dietziae]